MITDLREAIKHLTLEGLIKEELALCKRCSGVGRTSTGSWWITIITSTRSPTTNAKTAIRPEESTSKP